MPGKSSFSSKATPPGMAKRSANTGKALPQGIAKRTPPPRLGVPLPRPVTAPNVAVPMDGIAARQLESYEAQRSAAPKKPGKPR